MASIVGGNATGLLDSSLFLLNRTDKTSESVAGHEEDLYVNVSNGDLVVQHKDAYLPSQGDDYFLLRTYNSRGSWDCGAGDGWSFSTPKLDLPALVTLTKCDITLTNADSSQFNFTYDKVSCKWASVDGAGAYEQLSYSSSTCQWTLVRSNQSVFTFDNCGRLLSSKDTNGNLIQYCYDLLGRLSTVKDDLGHVVCYDYDLLGNLSCVRDEAGVTLVRYEYCLGKLTKVIDRSGHETVYSYNLEGQLSSITLPADNPCDPPRKICFDYVLDLNHLLSPDMRLLSRITDAQGNQTRFTYDLQFDCWNAYQGGCTSVLNALGVNRRESNEQQYVDWRLANGYYALWNDDAYCKNNAYKAQADAIVARHTVSYAYDKNGEINTVVDQVGHKTTYQYDAKENLTAIVDANGYGVTRSDDAYYRDLRKSFGVVDASGQGKRVCDLTAAEITSLLERYTAHMEYDANGNLIKKIDNADNVTTYTYTSFNKLASQTSAMGYALTTSDDQQFKDKRVSLGYSATVAGLTAANKTALLALYTSKYTYDAKQNVTQITSAGGDITKFEYDSYGNVTKKTVFLDPADLVTASKQQVTQYFYDAYGQNVKTIDGEGYVAYNTFDHFGNVLTHTDGRGGVTTYTYDKDNRVLTVTDPENNVVAYTYDAVGNKVGVRDANGHTITYVYDRNNMMLAVIDPKDGNAAANRQTGFAYDVVGNRTSVTDAEGRVTTYLYREDNKLLEVKTASVQNAAATGSTQYTTRYDYDHLGNQILTTDRNGNQTRFVYGQTELVSQVTDALGNVTQYSYDANLNQIQIIVGAQLATEKRRVLRFDFDEENQRISEKDALGGTTSYTRDAVGNVVSVKDANGNVTDYKFDKNNRLVTETKPAVTDPATGQLVRSTVTYQYDANGNRVAVTDENLHTTRYSFDKDDRLVLIEDANGIKTVYAYDTRSNKTKVMVGVKAHMDASSHVVIDEQLSAQVETYAYDEFNQLTTRTDGVGNALITSDDTLYKTLRVSMGYASAVASLSAADKQAILAAYSDRYTYDKVGNMLTMTDHLGRVQRMAYDSLNRVITRTDATTTGISRLRYDGNGNQVAAVDELGRTTTAVFDAVNRLVSSTDARLVTTTNTYDNVGNLVGQKRAANTTAERTSSFVYDLNNRLTAQTDAEGKSLSYEYDAVGNRLKVIDARNSATRYCYDARNRLIKTIDPLGFETKYTYDGAGNKLSIIDARGGVTKFEFDAGNRLVSLTDAEQRVTRYEYDVRGNRITQRTAAGTANEEVTQFEYDAQNKLRSVTDAKNNRTTYGFDAVYNRTSVKDANGNTTSYEFDALNRTVRTVDALGASTSYSYDAVGNVLTQTDALQRLTQFSYDEKNRVTTQTAADGVKTTYTYDQVDNRVSVTRAAGTGVSQTTTYAYDKNNRLKSQTDALGHVTTNDYDANGNVVKTTDPRGFSTVYEYDANNRVRFIRDAESGVTEYRYDGVGNRTQVIDALGHVTTSYFNLDREISLVVDAEGGVVGYDYDKNGNRTIETRYATRVTLPVSPDVKPALSLGAGDQVTRYGYDQLNRLTRSLDGEGYVVDRSYDAVGNLTQTKAYAKPATVALNQALSDISITADPLDRTVSYGYDKLNRRSTQIDAEKYLTAWTYDAVGNQLTQTRYQDKTDLVTASKQQKTSYTYDKLNRVTSTTSPIGMVTVYGYDSLGNRTSVVEASGTPLARTTTYEFDAANRLVKQKNAEGVFTKFDLDENGNILTQTDAFGLPEARVTNYTYDKLGRRIRCDHPDGMVRKWTYDAVGNLSDLIDAAGTPDERHTTYTYDNNNRVKQQSVGAGTAAVVTTAYTYDAFGNRKTETIGAGSTDAQTRTLTYDHLNRVIADANGSQGVVITDYDAFGNRIKTSIVGATKTASGVTIQRTEANAYEYDGRNLLVKQANGESELILRGYDAYGNLLTQTDASGTSDAQVTTFSYDLGNRLTAKVVDPSGLALSTSFEYDILGNLTAQTSPGNLRTSSTFDVMNRVTKTVSAEGFTTTFSYDKFSNQTSITTGQYLLATNDAGYDAVKAARAKPEGTNIAYDSMNRKVYQADALGVVTSYDYDVRGNKSAQSEAFGTIIDATKSPTLSNISKTPSAQRKTSFVYDAADHLTDEKQPAGAVVHYAYNKAGQLSAKTADYGVGASFRNATTRYFYDNSGRLSFEADATNAVTAYVYDDFGNQIREIRGLALDATGQPSLTPTSDTRVSAKEFDKAHRVTASVVDPDGLSLRTTYEYDERGNRIALVDANGGRSEVQFDKADRQVWLRDAVGYITARSYDARGNLSTETRYATQAKSLALGALPAVSADDRLTTFSYDAAGRLTEVTDARGLVTRNKYDAIGNLLESTENATSLFGSAPRVTKHTYNAANLVTQTISFNGAVTNCEYDSVYNKVLESTTNTWVDTLASGQPTRTETLVTKYEFDLNNRVVAKVVDPSGLNIREGYRYDGQGNLIATVGANGYAAATSDDAWAKAARRAVGVVGAQSADIAASALTDAQRQQVLDAYTTRYWFDGANRAVATLDASGYLKAASYDRVGNLTTNTEFATALTLVQRAALSQSSIPVVQLTPGTDRTTSFGFDKADRQSTVTTSATLQYQGGQWKENYQATTTTTFDGNGNVVQVKDGNGYVTYQYFDQDNRLIGKLDAAGYLTAHTLDAFGNITQERLFLGQTSLSAAQKATLDVKSFTPAGDVRVIDRTYDKANHSLAEVHPASTVQEGTASVAKRLKMVREFDAFGNVTFESVMHTEGTASPAGVHYAYDAQGHLISKREARADAEGALATTAADRAAIDAKYTTTYAYDSNGKLRETVEGDRVTTYVLDIIGRTTLVYFPATKQVAVDALGVITDQGLKRATGSMTYDAAGNKLSEVKLNGQRVDYRYDRVNNVVAALADGAYVGYGYNFAGEQTDLRRYYNAASDVDRAPDTSDRDFVAVYAFDKLGRQISEFQQGDPGNSGDDRKVSFGFDANGNQVKITDGRGFVSTVAYDTLNRVINTVNASGGGTSTDYDAQGNVINRQTGGWNNPTLVGQVKVASISNQGAAISWTTDHPADTKLSYRVKGTTTWTAADTVSQFGIDHAVSLNGLSASTEYEYYFASVDSFGYQLQSSVGSFRTVSAVSAAAISNVQQTAAGWSARLGFAVPSGASNVQIRVGDISADGKTLTNAQPFAVTAEAGASYSANLSGANPDAGFQITWQEADGVHSTEISKVLQKGESAASDISMSAVANGPNFDFKVSWNLSDALASSDIAFSEATPGNRVYSVYIGYTLNDASSPNYTPAQLVNGRFETTFSGVKDGARKAYLQYRRLDGSVFNGPVNQLGGSLSGLNFKQRAITVSAPGVSAASASLSVRYQQVGQTQWVNLPTTEIQGLTFSTLGVADGAYIYEATIQSASGSAIISGQMNLSSASTTKVSSSIIPGARALLAHGPNPDQSISLGTVSTSSTGVGSDHIWSYFDVNGRRTYSNENGGVWTRYEYDAAGNVVKEVRFQRRDAAGNFVDTVVDYSTRPDLAVLEADYQAAMAAYASSKDHARVITRTFDAAKNLLTETQQTKAFGDITTKYSYDRFNNKTLEISHAGDVQLELATRTTYDAANRVLSVEISPFTHADANGNAVKSGTTETFTYDARGNRSTHTDERGYIERFQYDAYNRLTAEWSGQKAGQSSQLKKAYQYDTLGRLTQLTATDLTGRGASDGAGTSQSTTYGYTVFDQVSSYSSAQGTSGRSYDQSGNISSETDTRGYTTYFTYDAGNHMTSRRDRVNATTTIGYDAYGTKVFEQDGNGRVTRTKVDRFGLATEVSVALNGYGYAERGRNQVTTTAYDWLGRAVVITDSIDGAAGKNIRNAYDDADHLVEINDLATGKLGRFAYDANGNRTNDELLEGGAVKRNVAMSYNERGWLQSVTPTGENLNLSATEANNGILNTTYGYDEAGNRIRVNGVAYTYDASNRMLSGFDGNRGQTVAQIVYDGFGNRVSVLEGGSTIGYGYDGANHVVSSTVGESWQYDGAGNTTYYRDRDGHVTTSNFNGENRVITTDSNGTRQTSTYDGVGNVVRLRTDGDGFGFDEVTRRDVRYQETTKRIENSWAKGARGLDGTTTFQYDANGQMISFDRGRPQKGGENSVASFKYDLEGHIIWRSTKSSAGIDDATIGEFTQDPQAQVSYDDYGGAFTAWDAYRSSLLADVNGTGSAQEQVYVYANGQVAGQSSGNTSVDIRLLGLNEGNWTVDPDTGVQTSNGFTLKASDVVTSATGQLDRGATLLRIAQRAYPGFNNLGDAGQKAVLAYIDSRLPTDASQVKAGATLNLAGFISVKNKQVSDRTWQTDYSIRRIGADSIPGGSTQNHVVRTGESLQSIAATYFGSSSYWYLIADANGLQGGEALAEGTVLTIPNVVANSVNDSQTFKVYNENEIIGSTSPEVRTIPKKKKWYQKLVQILIVVILVVAAVLTAGAALGAIGIIGPGAAGLLGVGASIGIGVGGALGVAVGAGVGLTLGTLAVAAVSGALIMGAANLINQGLAIAAKLQDGFSWKSLGKAVVSGAVSGAATAIGSGWNIGGAQQATQAKDAVNWARVALKVGVEAGKQMILEGKISNIAGLAGAAAGAGAFGEVASKYSDTLTKGLTILEKRVRGEEVNALDWVNLASSAVMDSGWTGEGYNKGTLTNTDGSINWRTVALKTVGAAIVGSEMGEDAALNYVGQSIGDAIAADSYRQMARSNIRTLQAKAIDAALAAAPDKAEQLAKLRDQVMKGEEGLTVEATDGLTSQSQDKANARYSANIITVDSSLLDNAASPGGAARLLAALAEETGEWVAAKADLTFTNSDGKRLDPGALLGMQILSSLVKGANGDSLGFTVNVAGRGEQSFETSGINVLVAATQQFTTDRLLANAGDSAGGYQLNMPFSKKAFVEKLVSLSQGKTGDAVDAVVAVGGFAYGVAEHGTKMVAGLAQLAVDALDSQFYLVTKAVGIDSLAKMYEGGYRRMEGMYTSVVNFFQDRSLGQAAYDVFAKPVADQWNRANDAYGVAIAASRERGLYSLNRAESFFNYGKELGAFSLDLALGLTGASALFSTSAKAAMFLGRSGAVLATDAAGGLTATIDRLAERFTATAARSSAVGESASVSRLAQDINVNATPPSALPLSRRIGLSESQNARLQADISRLRAEGATDFRVNQQQVTSEGVRVGVNRPDLQYTDLNGQRVYVEYDTDISTRGALHEQRIKANDPSARVVLIRQN